MTTPERFIPGSWHERPPSYYYEQKEYNPRGPRDQLFHRDVNIQPSTANIPILAGQLKCEIADLLTQ